MDIAVILDARRDQVYFQLFNQNLRSLCEPKLLMTEEVLAYLPKNIILVGDGIKGFSKTIDENLNIIANAKILAEASSFYWQQKLYQKLTPLYIREPDISPPKNITVNLI